MIETTKCAGVMVGRGALVRPWLFRDTWSYLTTGIIPPEPTIAEKCDMIRAHFNGIRRFRNDQIALLELRKRISWYAKSMSPCRMLKDPMREINSPEDFESILQSFQDWRSRYDEDVAAGKIKPIPREELVEAA